MRTLKPQAIGVLVSALGAFAVLALSTLGSWLTVAEPDPASTPVRAMLGVLWVLVQAGSLVSAYVASRPGFGLMTGVAAIVGISAMSAGRSGIDGLSTAWLLCVMSVATIAIAAAAWLLFRRPQVTAAHRIWRLFVWLTLLGGVYLYGAEPREAGAHLGAFAMSLVLCGAAALFWPSIIRAAAAVSAVTPSRLSILAWGGAVIALGINGIIAVKLGLKTPQVAIGPIAFAPYFFAAALGLIAVALDMEAVRLNGPRVLARTVFGLVLCLAMYVGLLDESGTLAILAVGTIVVCLMSGPTPVSCGAVIILIAGQAMLQARTLIDMFQTVLPRVAERLLVWTNQAAPPDQMVRVVESLQFSGAVGHMGAARMRFLIGPQVAKDYMPALISAQGGWLGLALMLTGSFLLLYELCMAARRTQSSTARAVQTAVLALLIANLLVTTLWIGGLTPFVGVPLPVLARAGSHLLILTLVLLGFDALSEADLRRPLSRR